MYTRSMNLGCFCVVCFDGLMCSPFVPKTVKQDFYRLACGDGCFSARARLVPRQGGRPAEAKRGVKKPTRSGLALKSSRMAQQ